VAQHPEWREKLYQNVYYLKSGLKQLGLKIDDSPIPIVSWTLKTAKEMKRIQQELLHRGIAIAYLKYVGAPARGVLRISIFSTHTQAHLDKLLNELKNLL
ncbi:MAG: aminotransferase class I/II-fold pyridoxal phosphate-dependent enzyme, partial [Candidatus Aminicenantes bacterium]|nr:aminotransferase class I/II-fold pyridoxal phosphate-dependent enzyme [Candidatus Aminicenantes bacterium]